MTPTGSVQPAETSTPDVTVTPPPLLIGQPTASSAVAFVKYFWDAYNYAYASYDTSVLEDISQPSCKYCASTIADVKRIAQAGTRISGSEVSLIEAALPSQEVIDRALVVAAVRQRPGTATGRDGSQEKLKGFANERFSFALAWTGGAWLVHGVDFDQKPASS